ncbi:hypothetical protein GCM10010174_11210 [Kutzneria viridogrisea]|uniref:Uncharacterized protein n=1 Tax=Kutzneria viridogrisea TaxID=47990 RepID=A0ABR6BIX7_9PSEU|nr:hypothetical protein [Kutzneria viridogrisea]
MDPRDRADAALARASARDRWVVTPLNATSPMDAKPTVQIPRAVVDAADPRLKDDPDITQVIPAAAQQQHQVPVPHQQQEQHRPPQQQPQPQQPQPPAEPEGRQLPGIIPTTQQVTGRRLSLSERLSGALQEPPAQS